MNKDHKSVNDNKSGLLKNGKPVFLAIGKIFKPHGLKGEVSADIFSQKIDYLTIEKQIYIGEKHIQSHIKTIKKNNKKYLISFVDHPTIDDVEFFRNNYIYIKEEELPELSSNEYYIHDLIGLNVFSTDGKFLGVISDVLQTGANDVYVIQPEGEQKQELLLPAIKDVVKDVNIEKQKMVIKIQEWR
jgi:16S rRNA processing protein RimM